MEANLIEKNVTWQLRITVVAELKFYLPSRLFHINLLNNRPRGNIFVEK